MHAGDVRRRAEAIAQLGEPEDRLYASIELVFDVLQEIAKPSTALTRHDAFRFRGLAQTCLTSTGAIVAEDV